jgi:uncharacterized protein (DUF427 family)
MALVKSRCEIERSASHVYLHIAGQAISDSGKYSLLTETGRPEVKHKDCIAGSYPRKFVVLSEIEKFEGAESA